jgi:hypothetical protein
VIYQAQVVAAPIFDPTNRHELANALRRGRRLFHHDAITSAVGADVLIAHKRDQRIGRVTAMRTIDWVTGLMHWFDLELDREVPWLRRGTGVSLGYQTISEGEVRGVTTVRHASLMEISLVPPHWKGYEPEARVLMIKETTERTSSPAAVSSASAAGEVIDDGPRVLIRPGIGRVLRVS